MKTQGFEARFSQNRTLKTLPRLYFTFIQQALSNQYPLV
jgi:hypothetical protein